MLRSFRHIAVHVLEDAFEVWRQAALPVDMCALEPRSVYGFKPEQLAQVQACKITELHHNQPLKSDSPIAMIIDAA